MKRVIEDIILFISVMAYMNSIRTERIFFLKITPLIFCLYVFDGLIFFFFFVLLFNVRRSFSSISRSSNKSR